LISNKVLRMLAMGFGFYRFGTAAQNNAPLFVSAG
jgi:hypothetical protein